jgi:hypothetical protein
MDQGLFWGNLPMFYSIARDRMSCNACNRWGPGTTKEKQPDTDASNELKKRLSEMAKERSKQDKMWIQQGENKVISKPGIDESRSGST